MKHNNGQIQQVKKLHTQKNYKLSLELSSLPLDDAERIKGGNQHELGHTLGFRYEHIRGKSKRSSI